MKCIKFQKEPNHPKRGGQTDSREGGPNIPKRSEERPNQ